MQAKLTLNERFWAKVALPNERGCREWLGGRNDNGYGWFYGRFRDGRPKIYAHRFAYIQAYGEPPLETPFILHSCDNPPCCELTHLRAGTQKENVSDRESRGRGNQASGEANGNAKLTVAEVEAIRWQYRAGGVSQRQLGAAFAVDHSTVSRIVNRNQWN